MAGHGSGRLLQLEPLDGWCGKQGKGAALVLSSHHAPREAVVQMREAKTNGAVAVCMRPLEGDRLLTNRYFYPIYEEASRLDLAIAIHIANANPANCDLWRTAPVRKGCFPVASRYSVARPWWPVTCCSLANCRTSSTLRWGLSRPLAVGAMDLP